MSEEVRGGFLTLPMGGRELSSVVRESLFMSCEKSVVRDRPVQGGHVWEREGVTLSPLVGASVCIGSFDGFHVGHRMLVQETMGDARERGIASVALTFDPLPAELLHLCGASGRHRLLSREERVRALLFAGLDAVIVLDFDRALADMGYEDFLARALPSLMAPRSIHVGSDFRLGRGGAGTVERLSRLGGRLNIEVYGHELVCDGHGNVSSTRVRGLLHEGDVGEAARLLDRLHFVSGSVLHGRGEGKDLGFPTANVRVDPSRCMPAEGVYGGLVASGGLAWPAAINVGAPPTFSGSDPSFLEANLVGFDGDLYGANVSVLFASWLRASRRFDSIEELERAVRANIDWVRAKLGDRGVEVAV